MSASRTFVHLSSWPPYHCTAVPDLSASPSQFGVLHEVNRLVAQSMPDLQVLRLGNPTSLLYALIGMTSTSRLQTGAKWTISFAAIAALQCSLACAIAWTSWPWVVMCAGWWGCRSLLRRCGDIKMPVTQQWNEDSNWLQFSFVSSSLHVMDNV